MCASWPFTNIQLKQQLTSHTVYEWICFHNKLRPNANNKHNYWDVHTYIDNTWASVRLKSQVNCMINSLFWRTSKWTSKLHITGHLWPVDSLYTRPVNAEIVSISWYYIWWRHQKEIFSSLLALYAGNSPVTGEFPSQRPVKRSFDVFFNLRLE